MARTDTVFKIGDTDFSNHVLSGSYKINEVDEFTSWTDANGREHRNIYRTKTSGSFDVLFKTVTDYEIFQNAYMYAKNKAGLVRVTLMDNQSNQLKVIDAYLDFTPVRFRADNWEDYYEKFTVNIKEW